MAPLSGPSHSHHYSLPRKSCWTSWPYSAQCISPTSCIERLSPRERLPVRPPPSSSVPPGSPCSSCSCSIATAATALALSAGHPRDRTYPASHPASLPACYSRRLLLRRPSLASGLRARPSHSSTLPHPGKMGDAQASAHASRQRIRNAARCDPGTGPAGRRIYSALVRSPKFGVNPVAFVDDDPQSTTTEIYEPSFHRKHSARVVPGPLCPELFHQLNASVLVIATSAIDRESMLLTNAKLSEAGVSIYFTPADFLEPGYWVDYADLDGIVLAHLSRGTNRVLYELGKRALDMSAAAIMLLLLAVLAPLITVSVKLTSAGPGVLPPAACPAKRDGVHHLQVPHHVPARAQLRATLPKTGDDPRITPGRPLSPPHQPG